MKIIVSDYDDTFCLYNNDAKENDRILKENVKAINSFRKNGNEFIVATGRYFDSINNEIIKNNIKFDYLICNYGAEIYDSNYNKIFIKPLDANDKKYLKKDKDFSFQKSRNNKIISAVKKNNLDNVEELYRNIKNSTIETKKHKIKIYPFGVSKYKALQMIIKKEKNVYCFGNNESDYEMLIKYKGFTLTNNPYNFNDMRIIKTKYLYEKIKEIENL